MQVGLAYGGPEVELISGGTTLEAAVRISPRLTENVRLLGNPEP